MVLGRMARIREGKKRKERETSTWHGGSCSGGLVRITGYAGGVITMIPTSGSVIISSPRHPRPKNRGTHVLNPVHVHWASTAPPPSTTPNGNHRRNRMQRMLYGLINHLVAPCRELRVALCFLPICSLLLGRIERFRGQEESGFIHMNLHRSFRLRRNRRRSRVILFSFGHHNPSVSHQDIKTDS